MGEPSSDEGKFLAIRPESSFVDADGNASIAAGAIIRNMSDGEVRESIAKATGHDPETIGIQSEPDRPFEFPNGRRKTSVGFRKWNSSWDPGAERGDPNLN